MFRLTSSDIFAAGEQKYHLLGIGATTPGKKVIFLHNTEVHCSLFLSTGISSLGLGGTKAFLYSAFDFLELLSCLCWSSNKSISFEEVLLIVLLSLIETVINESESGRSTTTEFGVETKDTDLLGLAFELFSELVFDGSLGDVGGLWMDELNLDLLSSEKWVVDDLSGVKNELSGHLFEGALFLQINNND